MRPHHRGVIRSSQCWPASSITSGGSMNADQDLEDIDKELTLLRRKREIIKQQNELFSSDFRGRNDYEESYNQGSHFINYAAPSYSERRDYNTAPNRKRPIPVWEDDLPPKRFSGEARPRSSRPRARPTPPPLMHAAPFFGALYQPRPVIRSKSGPYKPPKKDLPPKVQTKPARAPNKLATYPVAERKKLIASAIDLSYNVSESNRLCLDREPSKQLVGRLELALGCIFKDIKANSDPNMIKSIIVIREIKTILRDRIREIMMNKIVGSAETVIAQYRKVYDFESDIDVVISALDTQTGEFTLFQTEDPEKYFKVNMYKLMHIKLRKLLEKLEEICRAEMIKSPPYVSVITPGGASGVKNPGGIPDAEMDPDYISSTEKLKNLEKWMSTKMTVSIKKFLPSITKLMDMDMKYRRMRNTITSETVKKFMHGSQKFDVNVDVAGESEVFVEDTKSPGHQEPCKEYKPLPYFAKLLGRPALPTRNQMQQFFKQFNPKSIKKHRTMHNLLFVGFTDKDKYDMFLAADGTAIGKYVLSIRVGERSVTETVKEEFNASNISDDKLIGEELDEQITDLLTSIKKAEEDDQDDEDAGETDVKTECDEENAGKTEGDNENAGKTDDQMEDTTAESENNAGDADVNITENAEENITKDTDENITENTDENITKDTDENITENTDENITKDTDENITENTDENITKDTDENITKDTDEDIAENTDENITKDTDENITENTDENITKDTDENITKNTDENNTENADKNNAEPETADKIATDIPANGDAPEKNSSEPKPADNGPAAESADKVQPAAGWAVPAPAPARIMTRRASRLAQRDA